MVDMVEMKIFGLAVDEKAQSPVLILKDEARDLALPIWIGPVEAMAISLALNSVRTPRPMTHELLGRVVSALGAQLEAVEVVALREGTFYAEIVLKTKDGQKRIDARPSDAVALAARFGAPIRVAGDVLKAAGTRTIAGAKAEFGGTEGEKWTEELEKLPADGTKYKM